MRAEPPGPQHEWLDGDAGPVVRPYTLTGGRVRSAVDGFDLVAYVLAGPDADPAGPAAAAPGAPAPGRAGPPAGRRWPNSRPTWTSRSAWSGCCSATCSPEGLVAVHEPPAAGHLPDDDILKAVVSGLRAL